MCRKKQELNTFLTEKVLKRILKKESRQDLYLPNTLGILLFLFKSELP